MNRIFNIFIIMLVAVFFIGCSSDDDSIVSSIKVIESNVTFNAEQAKGSIIIESIHAFEAKSNKDWCIVNTSGNTINVDVTANTGFEGRNALITITNGVESVHIPVTQKGVVLIVNEIEPINFSIYKGGETSITFNSNLPVTIKTEDNWINYNIIENSSVTISVEETTGPRKGILTLVCGDKSVDIEVKQTIGKYQDLIGYWQLRYYDFDGLESVANVMLVNYTEGKSYILVGIPPFSANALVNYEEESGMLQINSVQYLGKYGQHYLYLTVQDTFKEIYSNNPAVYYAGRPDVDTKTNAWAYTFGDSGTWPGYQTNAIAISAYSDQLPNGEYIGDYERLQYCVLVKQ